jgi:hypothetical protein
LEPWNKARLNHGIPKNLADMYDPETEFPFRKAGRKTGNDSPVKGAGSLWQYGTAH